MIDLDFRTAASADIPALHALIEHAYRGESARKGWTHEADLLDGQRTDVEALAVLIADPSQRMIMAEVRGVLVGCVQIARAREHKAYLGHLSVEPERQGQGIGRCLVVSAENAAAQHFDARVIEMTVIKQRTELAEWYRRLGYQKTGEERPFPIDNPRFGIPKTSDLIFAVMARHLGNRISHD